MAIKKDVQSPKKGMNRNTAPFELSKEEYSFALNANIHDEHGSGLVVLQNESSNIKCTGFKEGYKVIGHKYDINADRTYFFLHNPIEVISEIGYIDSFFDNEGLVPTESQDGEIIYVVLEQPLEDTTQVAACTYTTLISDYCELTDTATDCLGFRMEYPIREVNIHIKDEKSGKKMFFTDGNTYQKYIQLDNIKTYFEDIDDCTGEITQTCLQCEKMRVFPLYNKPCLRPRVIQGGGYLKAGMYEALIAYSTIKGNELSDYYALTNPIPIHDPNNNILDQTNLDYQTNLAISIDVFDLDTRFDYYRIAVIYRSGLDGSITIFENGIYPINQDRITITSSQNRPRKITIADVTARRPFYEKAKGLASGNGYLYHYGLTAKREINLQPVVNLMGAFVRWQTIQAVEDLYKDGVEVSNYKGYMRDEVYPLSIKFITDGGYELPLFPFIPRPPFDSELDVLGTSEFEENTNTQSVLAYNPECSENTRIYRWQYENTAQILGRCATDSLPGYDEDVVERTESKSCIVEEEDGTPTIVDTIASSSIIVDLGGGSLVDYINSNLETLKNSTDSNGSDITQILNTSYPGDCDPEFGFNCEEPILSFEEVIAISVETEVVVVDVANREDYERIESPTSCKSLQVCNSVNTLDDTNPDTFGCTIGEYIEDSSFMADYMHSSQVVYTKNIAQSNNTCSNAVDMPFFSEPQSDFSQYFQHFGNNNPSTSSLFNTTPTVTAIDTEFTNKVGINALWYRIDFYGSSDKRVFELSPLFCNNTDDNTSNRLRVSVFQGTCGALVEKPAYSRVINDMTLANDPDKFFILDPADFSTDVIYIAVDTPLKREIDLLIELTSTATEITLTGTSGSATITIEGIDYSIVFNTDLTTTASDFVTAHAATILANHNIVVTSSAGVILFEDNYITSPQITITTNPSDPDLSGTVALAPSGSIRVTIDGINYDEAFDTDYNTTATNFATSYSAVIAINHGGFVEASGDSIKLSLPYNLWPLTFSSNLTGTLIGKPVQVAKFRNRLETPCGCYSIKQQIAIPSTRVDYTNLTFGKRQTYEATCSYSLPVLAGCNVIPFEYGLFSYWESVNRYPCNDELFDSSRIKIPVELIPEAYREEFEDYYVNSVSSNGNYELSSEANFMDKAIRHYKFPCSTIVPFMSYADDGGAPQDPGPFRDSVIYPIGITIDNDIINAFLDIAVLNGLLTQEERNRITSYEIFRGDRRTERSIIAKGLLYDTYKYKHRSSDADFIYYPNYPLNTLGTDMMNGGVAHPFNSIGNNRFTFHSPEIHFSKPSLPREMKIEGYQYGSAGNYFDEVIDHPTYVLLTNNARRRAKDLARLEYGLEIFNQVADIAGMGDGVLRIIAGLAFVGVGVFFTGSVKIAQYKQQWLDTFTNLGKPENFAYYGVSLGHYNLFRKNTVENSTLRGLAAISYLSSGRYTVTEEKNGLSIDINNFDREDSVFISVGQEVNGPVPYLVRYGNRMGIGTDTSRLEHYCQIGRSSKIITSTAAPYVSLKQYLPSQYGTITSIEWLHTGYCGKLSSDSNCDPIFGGDIYITRFALKRKFPFFTTTAFGLAPLTPYKYSDYFNVNPSTTGGRYFVDFKINEDPEPIGSIGNDIGLAGDIIGDIVSMLDTFRQAAFSPFFGENISKFNLDCEDSFDFGDKRKFYVRPPLKFYLYYYGIPYFLVESEVNCNYRYAKREDFENFYPNVANIIEWTQEKNIPIRTPNTYFYNTVYSSVGSAYPYRVLPIDYKREFYDKLNNLENTTIYSKQDNSETDIVDPWLLYKALDFYDFPKAYGRLVLLEAIESEQILGLFRNGMTIYGAIDVMRDRLTPETGNLGNGGIFAGRNINFNTTDLGYGGTQHAMKVSCEFGHYWCDAKRGKVFELKPSGQGFEDITGACEKWFKEHLPFKIIKTVPGMTDLDVDNAFKGLGITMGWDDRLKRVFITKRDYKAIKDVCYSDGIFHDTTGFELIIEQWESIGYTYEGIENCKHKFTIEVDGFNQTEYLDTPVVELTNSEYFEECSFTIAYSPLAQSWISYYSFKPNYYISYNDYFQTGINYSTDDTELGLWSHLPFLSSWQVFYGKLYPFTIEFPVPTQVTDSLLHSVEYWLDTRKYYNKYDFTDVYGIGFNKAIIYNNYQNSGQLELVHNQENNIFQTLSYPQFNTQSTTILQSEMNGKWSLNYFFNRFRSDRAGLPVFLWDCSQVEKTLDHRLLDYTSRFFDRLRGDYFIVNLTNDINSRFKYLFRFNIDKREYYES